VSRMQSTEGIAGPVRYLLAGLFACALFGFPLVSTLPVFLGTESRPVSLVYRAVIVVCSGALLAVALTRKRAVIPRRDVALVATLMAVLVARLVWDSSLAVLPLDLAWEEIWPFALGVTLLPAAAFFVRMDDSTLTLAFRWSLWLGIATALFLLAAAVVALRDAVAFLRLTTGVLNPIAIGHVGVSLFVLAVAGPTVGGREGMKHSARSVVGRGAGALIAMALIIASGSKGPMLAWLVVLLGWLVALVSAAAAQGRGTPRVLGAALVLALIVLAVVSVHAITPLPIVERFIDIGRDQSTSERVRLLTQAIAQFEESPWLGSAVYVFESRLYPHNIIVESLMVGGVLAFVLLVMLLSRGTLAAWEILRLGGRNVWLSLLYLQYVVDAMFSGSLYFSPQFWVISVAMLGLAGTAVAPATRQVRADTPLGVRT